MFAKRRKCLLSDMSRRREKRGARKTSEKPNGGKYSIFLLTTTSTVNATNFSSFVHQIRDDRLEN